MDLWIHDGREKTHLLFAHDSISQQEAKYDIALAQVRQL